MTKHPPRPISTSPLGVLLSRARMDQGLSQTDLAARIGSPRQHIQRWEAGTYTPSPATIEKLAAALGLDTDTICAAAGVIPPDIEAALTDGTMTDILYHRVRCALGI